MNIHTITIRVYGLLIHHGKILLSRERIKGNIYTKFPGGGLELGEGVIDCLKREFKEEAGIELNDARHFYTTEDFIPSAFDASVQVLSLYYKVGSPQKDNIAIADPDNLSVGGTHEQVLYWCELDRLNEEEIELPVDKIVVRKLIKAE